MATKNANAGGAGNAGEVGTPLDPVIEIVEPEPVEKPKRVIGVFNDSHVLIGKREVEADEAPEGVEVGDLPTNGTYKWDDERKTFIPLGHGFGQIRSQAPYTTEFVLARMIETTPEETRPIEANDWLDWYNETLRQQHEEIGLRRKRKGG